MDPMMMPGGFEMPLARQQMPIIMAPHNQRPMLPAVRPAPPATVRPVAQRPIARAQSDELPPGPRPAAPVLRMPSPEELGVALANRSPDVNWTTVRRRLDRLGVTAFNLERSPRGWHFSFALPGTYQRFEAEAITEADAIDRALAQAEK